MGKGMSLGTGMSLGKYSKVGQYKDYSLTEQEIFSIVYAHLMLQMETCRDKQGECVFEDAAGNNCAMAAFIDPSKAVSGAIDKVSLEKLINKPYTARIFLMDSLMNMHDAFEPADWEDILAEIAERYELVLPELVNGSYVHGSDV